MHKNEFELKKLAIEADKFGVKINLIQHAFTLSSIVGSIYLVISGLGEMVKSNPDSIGALAVVVEKLQINAILGYVVAVSTSIGWAYERSGKKRAIKKTDELRTARERDDPYNASSNLDENGHTPQ